MLDSGLQLGPYTILAPVGKGGMGEVYRALDTRLSREVAVKTLPEHLVADLNAVQRFEREAKALASLSHPNILTIYDVGSSGDIHFVVMELLKGETLRERMNRSPIPIEKAIELLMAVAQGVSAAHTQHITHRDLKPENIFITADDRIKILDFGLAKHSENRSAVTQSVIETSPELSTPGMLVGTLGYMSPEQVLGRDADERSDIFSLGCVLYEMLAGSRPFSRDTHVETLAAILREDPAPLTTTARRFSPGLDSVLKNCLAKDPSRRFQSVQDLISSLQIVLQGRFVAMESAPDLSIAVQYFENLSASREDEYFRDGITEDVITELSKIKKLKVISRSNVVGYRDKPVSSMEIAQQLHASYVLEGSIRRAGARFRITARLVAASDGHSVWNERYDREMQDIFDLQDELARSIAHALRITLSGQEQEDLAERPTDNPEAYDYYLRGRSHYRRRTRQDLEHALRMYERAVELQPDFALAYAGISISSSLIYVWYGNEPEWIKRGEESAERALSLAPHLPEALVAQSLMAFGRQNYEQAADLARQAISKKPHCDSAFNLLAASLFASDRLQEAADLADRAVEHSGDDYNTYIPIINAMGRLNQPDAAARLRQRLVQALQQQLDWVPEDARARVMLANYYAMSGQKREAIREAEEAVALRPKDANILYNSACVYGNLGMKSECLSVLRKAADVGLSLASWIEKDPDLACVRDDPEFKKIVEQVKAMEKKQQSHLP